MTQRSRNYGNSRVLEVAEVVHCVFAFDTLVAHLNAPHPVVSYPEPLFPDAHTALFVTWKAHSSPGRRDPHPHLRGCIGTLEPRQLHSALREYTLTSALRDRRFNPISAHELNTLDVTVSLLSCFETAQDWKDWEVGVHGLIIEFQDPYHNCQRSATFLPEVAPEQGWDHKQCIDALVKKAGYQGAIDASLRASLVTKRYQSTTHTLSYADYQSLRSHSRAMAPAVSYMSAA